LVAKLPTHQITKFTDNQLVPVLARVVAAMALLCAVSACAKVQAKTPAPAPLETPAPPSRVVVPVVLPPAPEPPPPATQPSTPVTAPRPPVTPPPAATSPPPKPPDKPATAPDTPPAPLSSDVVELERKTRQLVQDAQHDLDRVVPLNLNADAKAQYAQAQRFIAQALDGLKKKYYLYALGLAEKAANLAAQLPKGRLNLVTW
jgi:type IV secretory pathway VirB10-like protein